MFTNTRSLTVEWGQCDPAGIAFYPRYFEMFDAGTAHLFAAALGMTKREMLALRRGRLPDGGYPRQVPPSQLVEQRDEVGALDAERLGRLPGSAAGPGCARSRSAPNTAPGASA